MLVIFEANTIELSGGKMRHKIHEFAVIFFQCRSEISIVNQADKVRNLLRISI